MKDIVKLRVIAIANRIFSSCLKLIFPGNITLTTVVSLFDMGGSKWMHLSKGNRGSHVDDMCCAGCFSVWNVDLLGNASCTGPI